MADGFGKKTRGYPDASRSRQVITKLAADTRERLEKAGREDDDERDKTLESLFLDLIGDINEDVKIVLGTPMRQLQSHKTKRKSFRSREFNNDPQDSDYFYEVLASYYQHLTAPNISIIMTENLLPIFKRCNGSPFLPPIMALLLHERLMNSPALFDSYEYIWCCNMLIDGAQTLFWMDLNSRSQRFRLIHRKLYGRKRKTLERHNVLSKEYLMIENEIEAVYWSFFFNYNDGGCLIRVLDENPHAVNVCMKALSNQLRRINIEDVLIMYLKGSMALAHAEASKGHIEPIVSLRFQRCMYLLSQPGGPCYPPLAVRKAAFKCLNVVYPVSR